MNAIEQQRSDAGELLTIAKEEFDEYVRFFRRLQQNAGAFVDRSNSALRAMAAEMETRRTAIVQTGQRTGEPPNDAQKNEYEAHLAVYDTLMKNLMAYVDRTDCELAGLTLLIEQKRQNLITLDEMAGGAKVTPGEARSKIGQTFEIPPEVLPPEKKNGKSEETVTSS